MRRSAVARQGYAGASAHRALRRLRRHGADHRSAAVAGGAFRWSGGYPHLGPVERAAAAPASRVSVRSYGAQPQDSLLACARTSGGWCARWRRAARVRCGTAMATRRRDRCWRAPASRAGWLVERPAITRCGPANTRSSGGGACRNACPARAPAMRRRSTSAPCRPAACSTCRRQRSAALQDWLATRGLAARPLLLVQIGNKRTMRRGFKRLAVNHKHWPAGALGGGAALSAPASPAACAGADRHRPRVRTQPGAARSWPASAMRTTSPTICRSRDWWRCCERASGLLTVDSGPAHAAAAVGCPQVVLFGKALVSLYRPWGLAGADVKVLTGASRRRAEHARHRNAPAVDRGLVDAQACGRRLEHVRASPARRRFLVTKNAWRPAAGSWPMCMSSGITQFSSRMQRVSRQRRPTVTPGSSTELSTMLPSSMRTSFDTSDCCHLRRPR